MSRTPLLLEYAGPAPKSHGSLLATCWYLLCAIVIAFLVLAVVIARAVLLVSGVACVFAGTILLTLGGRRDATQRLARWSDLLRLWIGDILRPMRGWFRRRELAR